MVVWHYITMTKNTTIRIPDELANEAEVVALVQGVSVNTLIIDSLAHEIEKVRTNKTFTSKAKKMLDRDQELIKRLAQ